MRTPQKNLGVDLLFEQPFRAADDLSSCRLFGNKSAEQAKINVQNQFRIRNQCRPSYWCLQKPELGCKRKCHGVTRPLLPLINEFNRPPIESSKNLKNGLLNGGFHFLLGLAMRYDHTHLKLADLLHLAFDHPGQLTQRRHRSMVTIALIAGPADRNRNHVVMSVHRASPSSTIVAGSHYWEPRVKSKPRGITARWCAGADR